MPGAELLSRFQSSQSACPVSNTPCFGLVHFNKALNMCVLSVTVLLIRRTASGSSPIESANNERKKCHETGSRMSNRRLASLELETETSQTSLVALVAWKSVATDNF